MKLFFVNILYAICVISCNTHQTFKRDDLYIRIQKHNEPVKNYRLISDTIYFNIEAYHATGNMLYFKILDPKVLKAIERGVNKVDSAYKTGIVASNNYFTHSFFDMEGIRNDKYVKRKIYQSTAFSPDIMSLALLLEESVSTGFVQIKPQVAFVNDLDIYATLLINGDTVIDNYKERFFLWMFLMNNDNYELSTEQKWKTLAGNSTRHLVSMKIDVSDMEKERETVELFVLSDEIFIKLGKGLFYKFKGYDGNATSIKAASGNSKDTTSKMVNTKGTLNHTGPKTKQE